MYQMYNVNFRLRYINNNKKTDDSLRNRHLAVNRWNHMVVFFLPPIIEKTPIVVLTVSYRDA